MPKSYVTLRLKNVYSYNYLKSKLSRPLPPDLLICGHDGYGRKIHSALLVILSPKFSSWCEAVRDNGHTVNNFLIPTMDRLGIECLKTLLYTGYFRIDELKANDVITQITQLDLAVTVENQHGEQIGDISGSHLHHHDLTETGASRPPSKDGMMNVIMPNSPECSVFEPLVKIQTSSPNSSPPLFSETNSDGEGSINNGNGAKDGSYMAMNGNEHDSPLIYDNGSDYKESSNTNQSHSNKNKSPYGPRLPDGRYKCSHCDKTFANSRNRKEHILALHLGHTLPCPKCGAKFRHRSTLRGHLLRHPKTDHEAPNSPVVNEMDSESQLESQA